MEFYELVERRRSIRRFKQTPIPDNVLLSLIDAASSAPSAGNAQPLRYIIVRSKKNLDAVFSHTLWGAHVRPRRNPVQGKSAPMAYIAVCCSKKNTPDERSNAAVDAGAAIMSILFAATNRGLGCCWLGAFNKRTVGDLIGAADKGLDCLFLVAVGEPDEKPVPEQVLPGGVTAYRLDGDDVIHVPKYPAQSVTSFI